jgi:uncharacterized membrane protein
MPKKNIFRELLEIIWGILLLFFCHFFVLLFLFMFSNIAFIGGFNMIFVIGFPLSQLLYAVPLAIDLKRQGKIGQMKGVIIGAVITALIYGGCFLLLPSIP